MKISGYVSGMYVDLTCEFRDIGQTSSDLKSDLCYTTLVFCIESTLYWPIQINFLWYVSHTYVEISSFVMIGPIIVDFCPFMCLWCSGVRSRAAEEEEMGCTSAKQVSAVPNGEEGQNKAYSNGDLLSGQSVRSTHWWSYFSDSRVTRVCMFRWFFTCWLS